MQRIAQTILAIIIALSVATLPAAAGFAAVSASTADLSGSSAMPDCDHHNHATPAGQPQKSTDDLACLAACALHCFSFTATDFSGIAFSSPASAALKPVRMNGAVSSLMGSPPFRPPRI
jgi:uncharacterized protein involved in copper resistance